jgi:hypothetical protein
MMSAGRGAPIRGLDRLSGLFAVRNNWPPNGVNWAQCDLEAPILRSNAVGAFSSVGSRSAW